jgi:hypothetical protein
MESQGLTQTDLPAASFGPIDDVQVFDTLFTLDEAIAFLRAPKVALFNNAYERARASLEVRTEISNILRQESAYIYLWNHPELMSPLLSCPRVKSALKDMPEYTVPMSALTYKEYMLKLTEAILHGLCTPSLMMLVSQTLQALEDDACVNHLIENFPPFDLETIDVDALASYGLYKEHPSIVPNVQCLFDWAIQSEHQLIPIVYEVYVPASPYVAQKEGYHYFIDASIYELFQHWSFSFKTMLKEHFALVAPSRTERLQRIQSMLESLNVDTFVAWPLEDQADDTVESVASTEQYLGAASPRTTSPFEESWDPRDIVETNEPLLASTNTPIEDPADPDERRPAEYRLKEIVPSTLSKQYQDFMKRVDHMLPPVTTKRGPHIVPRGPLKLIQPVPMEHSKRNREEDDVEIPMIKRQKIL